MTRNTYFLGFCVLALGGLAGCSSAPPAKQATAAPDKIQGKAQVVTTETTALDTSLNAGGPSVYLVHGLNRYRLFFNKAFQVDPGKEYVAEGVYAQKAIDAIGDPNQGKNGYPLDSSCDSVVRMAWPGLSFDDADSYSTSLRRKVSRFPARPSSNALWPAGIDRSRRSAQYLAGRTGRRAARHHRAARAQARRRRALLSGKLRARAAHR